MQNPDGVFTTTEEPRSFNVQKVEYSIFKPNGECIKICQFPITKKDIDGALKCAGITGDYSVYRKYNTSVGGRITDLTKKMYHDVVIRERVKKTHHKKVKTLPPVVFKNPIVKSAPIISDLSVDDNMIMIELRNKRSFGIVFDRIKDLYRE